MTQEQEGWLGEGGEDGSDNMLIHLTNTYLVHAMCWHCSSIF